MSMLLISLMAREDLDTLLQMRREALMDIVGPGDILRLLSGATSFQGLGIGRARTLRSLEVIVTLQVEDHLREDGSSKLMKRAIIRALDGPLDSGTAIPVAKLLGFYHTDDPAQRVSSEKLPSGSLMILQPVRGLS